MTILDSGLPQTRRPLILFLYDMNRIDYHPTTFAYWFHLLLDAVPTDYTDYADHYLSFEHLLFLGSGYILTSLTYFICFPFFNVLALPSIRL